MRYYKLETYVPEDYAEAVKEALSAAGAGRMGDYDHCFWQTPGQGEFRALESAHPYIGTPGGGVEHVREVKLETLVAAADRERVITALKAAHPYECCAYYLFPVEILEQ